METSNKTKAKVLIIIYLCLISVTVFAQGPGFDDGVEDTPIDGGATVMIAAAAGYGIKKLREKRNAANK